MAPKWRAHRRVDHGFRQSSRRCQSGRKTGGGDLPRYLERHSFLGRVVPLESLSAREPAPRSSRGGQQRGGGQRPAFRVFPTAPRRVQRARGMAADFGHVVAQFIVECGIQVVRNGYTQLLDTVADPMGDLVRIARRLPYRVDPLVALAERGGEKRPGTLGVVVEQGDEVRDLGNQGVASGHAVEETLRRVLVKGRRVLDGHAGDELAGHGLPPRQHEREAIDRLDLQAVGPVLEVPMAFLVALADRASHGAVAREFGENALAHLVRGLVGEGDGKDFLGTRDMGEQVEVAGHEQAGLSGARRCFQNHGMGGVNGLLACPGVRCLARCGAHAKTRHSACR